MTDIIRSLPDDAGAYVLMDSGYTNPSLLLSNGIPMKQIQIWLGHSIFSTTADIYVHLDFSVQSSLQRQ